MRWLSVVRDTNRNVSLTFLYRFSNATARGIWSHASMATYVYLLEHKSAKVPSLNDAANVLAAITDPSADNVTRSDIIVVCSGLG